MEMIRDVSKLEKRADLMIATPRKTVDAIGGRAALMAVFLSMKQKLFVPFRAQYWAFHYGCLKTEGMHCARDLIAASLMEQRIAHNSTFAYLAAPYFKLRLDEYYHLALSFENTCQRG